MQPLDVRGPGLTGKLILGSTRRHLALGLQPPAPSPSSPGTLPGTRRGLYPPTRPADPLQLPVRPSSSVRLLEGDYPVRVLSQPPGADTAFLPVLLARYSSSSAASTRSSSILVETLRTATPTEIVTGRNSEAIRGMRTMEYIREMFLKDATGGLGAREQPHTWSAENTPSRWYGCQRLAPSLTPTGPHAEPFCSCLACFVGDQVRRVRRLKTARKAGGSPEKTLPHAYCRGSGFPTSLRRLSGADGDRTRDLHAASVALSRLSYGPNGPLDYSQ